MTHLLKLSVPLDSQMTHRITRNYFKCTRGFLLYALLSLTAIIQLWAAPSVSDIEIPNALRPKFSKGPTDAELMQVRLFKEPLAPMEGEAINGENAALARAVDAFAARSKRGGVSALETFVAAFPKSRWNAALLLNIGLLQYGDGAFSRALASFDRAWDLSKTAKAAPATFIRDRAAAEAGRMNARLGNRSWLDKFMPEVNGMEISGSAGEMVNHTRAALSMMHTLPEKSFMCGPYALLNILPADVTGEVREVIRQPLSTPQGTSLAQVHDLSKKTGKKYQVAFRTPGSKLIVPAVVHWNVGHFAALVAERDGGVVCQDPTFGDEVFISAPVVDQEASGYYLVPQGALPKGWRAVDTEEAATIWGKGIITDKSILETFIRAVMCKILGPCAGMATYNVHAMLVGLTISDTPVGYSPAYGPSVNFTATYSQRDVAQPSQRNYSNLGAQWSHNWLSFLEPSGTTATLAEPSGGAVVFSGFNSGTGLYTFDARSASTLKLVSAGRYERTFAGGAKQVFTLFDGTRYFLTSIVDAAGRAVSLAYDTSYRLTGITDAAGLVTTIAYSGSDYKIQTVTDPFGRSASFSYDAAGRLEAITDVVGITSQFVYEGSGTFIKALTTPYGTTNFSFADNGQNRWFEARDPDGNVERTEFLSDAPAIGYGISDPTNSIPSPAGTSHLRYRNTFFWDKKAYAEGKDDLTKAHIFHWLHEGPGYSQTSGVLESEKTPFEGRVCYLYQGQDISSPWYITPGMFTGSPARILRKLSTNTTPESTQETRFVFNALGLPTSSIDPAGRETRYTYAANNIDLLTVERKNGSNYEKLAGFTYNSQHLPLTSTDASGQSTTRTYNANGQLETVTNALNKTTTCHYDSQGRLEYIDGPLTGDADRVSFTYDTVVLNRVKTVTYLDNGATTYDYDNLDRLTKVTYPDETYEETVYNRLDPEWTRDRAGRWTRYWHNSLRQLVAVQDPAGRMVEFDGCACGDKSIVDGNGEKTVWKMDVAGRLLYKEYSDGSRENYFYDLAGRLDHVVDPGQKTRSYAYKVDNNLLSLTYPAGASTASVTFTYGTIYNRMDTMVDPTGTTAFNYNPITSTPALGAGRLLSVDGPLANDTITYEYDELGRVDHRAINSVARDFLFDDASRLTRETNSLGQFDYGYDGATSRLATATAPNGVASAFTYYALPHDRVLDTITHTGPGSAAISSFSYGYDEVGNITSWTQNQASNTVLPVAAWILAMDPSNQLTGVSVTGQPTLAEVFGYDNGGNRLTRQKGNVVASTTFNDLNQIEAITGGGKLRVAGTTTEPSNVFVQGSAARMLSATNFVANPSVNVGTNVIPVIATDGSGNSKTNNYQVVIPTATARSFAYDDNGNLTSDGLRTYESDGLNRLVKVTQGTDVYEFAYDGFNRRISEKKNNTLIKRFVWDGLTLAEERDANNAVTKRFFPQGEMQDATNYFYARDHLGSVREVTDATGAIVASYSYDAWGKSTKLTAGADLATFGYTGHYTHPETNLVLAPFRVYDPETGRWLYRDPIGESGGINLYGYVANDPVNWIDPLGLEQAWYNQVNSVYVPPAPGPTPNPADVQTAKTMLVIAGAPTIIAASVVAAPVVEVAGSAVVANSAAAASSTASTAVVVGTALAAKPWIYNGINILGANSGSQPGWFWLGNQARKMVFGKQPWLWQSIPFENGQLGNDENGNCSK